MQDSVTEKPSARKVKAGFKLVELITTVMH